MSSDFASAFITAIFGATEDSPTRSCSPQLLATAALLAFPRPLPVIGRLLPWTFFFLATASHGLLDAMTDGGLGVAFFSPFDKHRYFFPWTPIRVSPIGLTRLFQRARRPGLRNRTSLDLDSRRFSCGLCLDLATPDAVASVTSRSCHFVFTPTPLR
jgi:hypothetical protein